MLFDVRTERGDGTDRVRVIGEIDLATVPLLRQHLRRVEGPRVIVDLTAVGYCDSIGVGVLIGARRRIVERGGSLAVVCPAGRVRELFTRSGVDSILDVRDDGPPPEEPG